MEEPKIINNPTKNQKNVHGNNVYVDLAVFAKYMFFSVCVVSITYFVLEVLVRA